MDKLLNEIQYQFDSITNIEIAKERAVEIIEHLIGQEIQKRMESYQMATIMLHDMRKQWNISQTMVIDREAVIEQVNKMDIKKRNETKKMTLKRRKENEKELGRMVKGLIKRKQKN